MSKRSVVEGPFKNWDNIVRARKIGSGKLRAANRERALQVKFGQRDNYMPKRKTAE